MLHVLPIEISLSVLTHLTIRDVHALQRVHSSWNEIIRSNEASIFYYLAINHGFVKTGEGLEEAHWAVREDRTDGIAGWKELCMRRVRLEKNWEGRGQTPSYRSYENTIEDAHRFKIDERPHVRIIVSTHRNGGLRVTDMDNGEALWELDDEYVRPYAHCEYDRGYLIFDRSHPHALEVWRLRCDADKSFSGLFSNVQDFDYRTEDARMKGLMAEPHPHVGREFGPEITQFNASVIYREMGCGRVEFVPWALFEPEHHPRAYRFVYPTLLAGSEIGQCVYLFDCPSATIIETITIPPPDEHLTQESQGGIGHVHIQYVELGARHVFVCSPSSIIILPRSVTSSGERVSNGTRQALHFPQADPVLRVPQLVRHYAAKMRQAIGSGSNEALQEFTLSAPREPDCSAASVQLGLNRQNFTAVHVSTSGSDFVGITGIGIMYIVKDFERVARGETTFSDITLRVDLNTGAYNLAYDNDRILVQTAHAIFVFNLHSTEKPFFTRRNHYGLLPLKPDIYPDISVYKLLEFTSGLPLRLMSCIKLSPTCIWLDWSENALQEVERRRDPNIDETTVNSGHTDSRETLFLDDHGSLIPEAVEEDHPAANRCVVRIGFLPGDSPLFGTLSPHYSNARLHL